MPLHIKASDQAGIQGNPIFDPVGTNEYVKTALIQYNWQSNLPIPVAYSFLGKEVDFGKAGIIIEIQFSNYPYLLLKPRCFQLLIVPFIMNKLLIS